MNLQESYKKSRVISSVIVLFFITIAVVFISVYYQVFGKMLSE